MKIHEKYIKRCIELAKCGLFAAMPNPSVGAVIVYKDKIIGEGYTSPYGGSHAEVNAIKAVKDPALLKEATLYVSLEPCSHYGKTPPCSDLIVKSKIPKVVIGTTDSNQLVSGKGIKILEEAGIETIIGVLEAECREANKRFFTFHEKKRPYIILKWAETADGFIAPAIRVEKAPVWITNEFSRQLVHKWRSEEQAILVGTQTVIDDNPKLNVRDWYGKDPKKIILDKNNRIPEKSYIFDFQDNAIIITDRTINFSKDVAKQLVSLLFEKNLLSVIIEGGRQTLQTFIDENLWDEARVFVGSETFSNGIKPPTFTGKRVFEKAIKQDKLFKYINYD